MSHVKNKNEKKPAYIKKRRKHKLYAYTYNKKIFLKTKTSYFNRKSNLTTETCIRNENVSFGGWTVSNILSNHDAKNTGHVIHLFSTIF